MAIADVLLLWSGAQAVGQQSSRGGPVSTARPTDWRRFSMSFAVGDVEAVTGVYPRPGVEFLYVDDGGQNPWLTAPLQPSTLITLNVIEIVSVARTVRATYSVQSYLSGATVSTNNATIYFSEEEWSEFSDCYIPVGEVHGLWFRMNPSLLDVGSRSFRIFPSATHPDDFLSHTGSFVSGQTLEPTRAMSHVRLFQHAAFPVFMQNFPEFTPAYQSDPFSANLNFNWSTGVITLEVNYQGAATPIVQNTGLQYRKYYVAAHMAWVVMCIDTDWLGAYGARRRVNISNYWMYFRVVKREDGFFLPQVLRGGTVYNNLQSHVGYYLWNISDGVKTVYFRRSDTAVVSGYELSVRDDFASPGVRMTKSPDGNDPAISSININSGLGVGTSPLLVGDLDPGEYGGFWLRQNSTTSSPADDMWVPLNFDIAAI